MNCTTYELNPMQHLIQKHCLHNECFTESEYYAVKKTVLHNLIKIFAYTKSPLRFLNPLPQEYCKGLSCCIN